MLKAHPTNRLHVSVRLEANLLLSSAFKLKTRDDETKKSETLGSDMQEFKTIIPFYSASICYDIITKNSFKIVLIGFYKYLANTRKK